MRQLVLIWIVAASAGSVVAQTAPLPGDTVRVRSAADDVTGVVRALGGDGLLLELLDGRGEVHFPPASIQRLWVRRGVGRRTGKGALVGALTMGGIGFLLGAGGGGDAYLGPGDTAILFAPVGLLFGAMIGSTRRGPRWERATPALGVGLAMGSLDSPRVSLSVTVGAGPGRR